jgi:hypothetical protein
MKKVSRKTPKIKNPAIYSPKSPGLLIYCRDLVRAALKRSRIEHTTPAKRKH